MTNLWCPLSEVRFWSSMLFAHASSSSSLIFRDVLDFGDVAEDSIFIFVFDVAGELVDSWWKIHDEVGYIQLLGEVGSVSGHEGPEAGGNVSLFLPEAVGCWVAPFSLFGFVSWGTNLEFGGVFVGLVNARRGVSYREVERVVFLGVPIGSSLASSAAVD